jgi:hypothetical protein
MSALIVPLPDPPEKCDVCAEESQRALWRNRTLLGSDHGLCHACFLYWYDQGITDGNEIRRRRLEDIARAAKPNP